MSALRNTILARVGNMRKQAEAAMAYEAGFCKAAEVMGVDPRALAKRAYSQADVDNYKGVLTRAGEAAAPYLTEQERTQPLPSVDDIRNAWAAARTTPPGSVDERFGRTNPAWASRFAHSLDQERFMDKERFGSRNITALRGVGNLVRGTAVRRPLVKDHGGYFSHREIPESVFRGAWPAFTNAVNYGSAPVRPPQERVVLGK